MNTIPNPIHQILIHVLLIENDQQAFLFPVLNFVLLCLNWVCTYSRPTEAAQFQFQGSSISILVFREELYFYSHLLWNFCFWKITQEKAMLTLPRINFRDLTKKLRSPLHFCLLSFHLQCLSSFQGRALPWDMNAHWCSYTLARELLVAKIICTGGLW